MAVAYSQNGTIVLSGLEIDVIGGKKYRTVHMPDGNTWLAENLDFKFCTIGGSSGIMPIAWYYNNDETTYGWNGHKCGLLYNWYAVKLLNDHRSELCAGWHIPTRAEYESLINACGGTSVAGTKLKALDGSAGTNWPSGWNGTDDYGCSILPTGGYGQGSFWSPDRGYMWTSTEFNGTVGHLVRFISDSSSADIQYDPKTYGYAVRLVRDAD